MQAQVNLGAMYADGLGVARDAVEAVRWFRVAADRGHAGAQYNLGFAYGEGRGVARDDAEAVRWLRLAADQGHPLAQATLGFAYAEGRGIAQDLVAAHTLLSLAAERTSTMDREAIVAARDALESAMTAEQLAQARANLGGAFAGARGR